MSIESAIRQFFDGKPQVISVDLFGSWASQRQTESSDIDIAILCTYGQIPSALQLVEWREELQSIIHKDVDLICLNEASPILGMQVAKNGKNLLKKNNPQYEEYLIHLFSMYAELKQVRAPMEKNILKRKIHD